MHAAWSVIVFTVSSGAGLGLLVLGGALAALGLWQPGETQWTRWLWLGGALLALGLACSSLHLANPRNAWRAWMRFRSSWLSREAVLAAAILPLLLLMGWLGPGRVSALLLAVLALATLYCTAMIYACLKTIRQWHDPLTVPYYLLAGLASGALLGAASGILTAPAAAALVLAFVAVRVCHWRRCQGPGALDASAATGLGGAGRVRLLDTGHSGQTFLSREFGGTERSAPWLRPAIVAAGVLSALLAALPWLACSLLLAVQLLDRRLFFVEATHVVRLYHGQAA